MNLPMNQKKVISFLIIISVVLLNFTSLAQNVSNGQFIIRGNGDDYGNTLELLDGNFLYVGTTTTYGIGARDILVVKFAQDFSILWQKTIGTTADEYVFDRESSFENTDGTIMIIGNSSSGLIGGDDMLLLKLSSVGNFLWSKVYGGGSDERGITVEKCLDGGYILGGNTYSYPNGKNNIYLVKVDSLGNSNWNWSFGNTQKTATQVTDIVSLADSSYIFSGIYDGSPSNGNSFIGRVDKNGLLLWINRYTFSNNFGWEGINGLALGNNYVIANGVTRGFLQHGGLSDGIVMSLDFNGSINWSKVYGGVGDDWLYKVDIDNQQNISSVVYTSSVGFGSFDMGLLKLNSLGNVLAYNVFGSSGVEHAKFFSNTADGGAIVSGSTTGLGAIQKDGIITKLDSNWFVDCNLADELINESTVVLIPEAIVASSNTSGSEMILTLSSSNVSIIIDTLCKSVANTQLMCNITSDFSSSSFCLGDSSNFSDLSFDNNASITNWQWYFGDGDSIIGDQNPAHLYGALGTFNVTLTVTNDSNCVDSIIIPIEINSVYNLNIADSICQGDNIFLGGTFQNTEGIYTDSLQSISGCDSVITTTLTVNSVYNSTQNQVICEGDSILFRGIYYKTTGLHKDSLQSVFGCDSLMSLNLIVYPSYQASLNQNICDGDSILFDGNFIGTTGNYFSSNQTINGCDSTMILNLMVSTGVQVSNSESICQGDSTFLGGAFQTSSGIYIDSLLSSNACDSVVVTTLNINISSNVVAFFDTTVNKGDQVQLSANGSDAYSWTPNYGLSCDDCQYPIGFPQVTTSYILEGISGGCSSFDTITITVNEVSTLLFIPNSFTPNGDFINDELVLLGEYIDEFKILVFNRWGELLFESNNILNSWGGFYKGQEVPSGVYVYKVKVLSKNSENIEKYGRINLIR